MQNGWQLIRLGTWSAPIAQWLLPAFGDFLIALLWFAVAGHLSDERRLILDSAKQETKGVAATFEQRTLRTIKNADVTTLMLKYLFERDGSWTSGKRSPKGLFRPKPIGWSVWWTQAAW
jgi:hypothetical protein